VLTKTNLVTSTRAVTQELRQINSRALIVESKHQPFHFRDIFTGKLLDLESIKTQKVLAFCAIGDPLSFRQSLQSIGSELVQHFTFADHHIYSSEDLKYLTDLASQEKVNILVTTHKDAVKIAAFRNLFGRIMVLSLDIELTLTQGQDEIIERILSLRRH
jgi:tetraacyldisaccharide-1-P 4'-kinase